MGSLSLLQELFPTQRLNPGLPHCRQILYQLSHKGSPRILEWVAYPFSSRSSRPKNQTRVSCIAGGFFTSQATREAQQLLLSVLIRYGLSNPFLWEDREESKQPKLVGTSKRLVHIRWFIQQIITGTYHGGDLISILGQFSWEESLEKEMATHSSIFACRISWTEEPCRLQSMGS